jgi:hypothetical protein
VIPGDQGVLFQPCYLYSEWIEWVPRDKGGGFVARHPKLPADAKPHTNAPGGDKCNHYRPNGNDLVFTRYAAGIVHQEYERLPFSIAFVSTGHMVINTWQAHMGAQSIPPSVVPEEEYQYLWGKRAPIYFLLYRLRTKRRSNNRGEWFTFDPDFDSFITQGFDINNGAAFRKLCEEMGAVTEVDASVAAPASDNEAAF